MPFAISGSGFGEVPSVGHKKKDDPKRVHEAAQQFEGLMISQMLKSMRESGAGLNGDSDAGNSTALEMAEVEFAKALSQRGGLGLANQVEAGLQHQAADATHGSQKLKE